MIHFFYLAGFALFVGAAFGVFSTGSLKEKVLYAVRIFAQFLLVSIVLAWIFYFLPG